MKQITEQMLQDRFAVGFMFGVIAAVLVSISSIGFYIYFTNKKIENGK
ncbi:MAG: hypothetical protein KA981_12415 [Bacteroidia bacterium]|nr:hypothetical protein [Bacteroidia bacterium]